MWNYTVLFYRKSLSASRDQTVATGPGAFRTSQPDLCEPSTSLTTPNIRPPLLIYAACLLRFVWNANGWSHTNYS
jgi:hypothetical protein